jgi:hypothetical protein
MRRDAASMAMVASVAKPLVVIDLGYLWPAESGPARERQRAVTRQLSVFFELRARHSTVNFSPIKVCGAGVAAISERLDGFGHDVSHSTIDLFEMFDNSDLIYLSPDAEEFLDTSQGWPLNLRGEPLVFIIGGIIDRKVKRGKSQRRACSHQVRALQLPLGDANGDPLNIDTVLTMLFYWKAFEDSAVSSRGVQSELHKSDARIIELSESLSRGMHVSAVRPDASTGSSVEARSAMMGPFERARLCALHEHTTRHPNQGKHVL